MKRLLLCLIALPPLGAIAQDKAITGFPKEAAATGIQTRRKIRQLLKGRQP